MFFALIGGVAVFGAIGLVVGPLALAYFLTMVHLWRRDFADSVDAREPQPPGTGSVRA